MNAQFSNIADDLELLISILPPSVQSVLRHHPKLSELIEIVLDLGRHAEFRFDGRISERITQFQTTAEDIRIVTNLVGDFNADNRAGIERTLHRISAIRNRKGDVVGLTCRVGRAITGTIEIIRDLVEGDKNLLLLGQPGIGKTTKLREIARVLADELNKRVIVVDTSNEIAGDGDIPHPGIGSARRLQVTSPDLQHAVMIEAVENHMPEVIIVDEIGTEEEAKAARTIAERGVQLVATAHGYTLENLIKNPTLSDLVGGVQTVILGDEEAKFRGTQKTVSERKTYPTFDSLVEIQQRDVFAIYHDLKEHVDRHLQDEPLAPEIRKRTDDGDVHVVKPKPEAVEITRPNGTKQADTQVTIYPYGINVDRLYLTVSSLNVPVRVTNTISDADMVLTVRSQMKSKAKITQLMQGRQIQLHVLKRNSSSQIAKFFKDYFELSTDFDDLDDEASAEIRKICVKVKGEKKVVEASPRNAFHRRLQHQVVHEEGLNSLSVGEEPNRRVRVYPR